jgi:hypothetical protein
MPKSRKQVDAPLQLDQMTTAAKIRTMEMLWDDLCRRPDGISSPIWRNEVLAEREQKVLSGEAKIEDWETAKVKMKESIS